MFASDRHHQRKRRRRFAFRQTTALFAWDLRAVPRPEYPQANRSQSLSRFSRHHASETNKDDRRDALPPPRTRSSRRPAKLPLILHPCLSADQPPSPPASSPPSTLA